MDWGDAGQSVWDFVTSDAGGAAIGGIAGGVAGYNSSDGGVTDIGSSEYESESSGSSQSNSNSMSRSGSQNSSKSSSWDGTASYMDPYTTGEQGIYPLAQGQYLDNMGQGYIGQSSGQQGINSDIANTLQQYLTNPNAVQQGMDQAGSFGDRYNSSLQGVNPNVQKSMNQFLGGQVDTNTLDSLQRAATNRAMVGYGDAVQDAGNMWTQEIAPSIRSDALLSGQYGGSRQGVAEGVSSGLIGQQLTRNARDLGLGSMDVGTQLYGDAYQQARDNQYGMSQFGAGFGLEQNEQGMRNLAQNAGMEQTGLGLQDDAINRYMAGQQGSYDALGRDVTDARAGQDFGWQQLLNYMGAIQGEGQESTSSSSSQGTSYGMSNSVSDSSSENSASSSGSSITGVADDEYNWLTGAEAGGTIGQGISGLLR